MFKLALAVAQGQNFRTSIVVIFACCQRSSDNGSKERAMPIFTNFYLNKPEKNNHRQRHLSDPSIFLMNGKNLPQTREVLELTKNITSVFYNEK